MDLILLSGESISNKTWIEEVDKSLQGLFDKTKILYYSHWRSGKEYIELDEEFSKLPDLVIDLKSYSVFAKSIGSVLSLRGIAEKVLHPEKCIFVGPALIIGEKTVPGFQQWIKDFSIPTLYITKTSDPVAPAKELRDLLKRYHVQNYSFVEIPGDNHKYENITKIITLVNNFMQIQQFEK